MNIELRQWCFNDTKSLVRVMNDCDRSLTDYSSFPLLDKCDNEEAISRIRRFVDMTYYGYGYAQAIVVDGEVVGHAQIVGWNDFYGVNCDFNIILLPDYCSKGIGTWVLKEMIAHAVGRPLNYSCLYATFFENNLAARGMCEKAGLQYVGDAPGAGGEPRRKLIFGIQCPRPEMPQKGVCLMAWERWDIDRMALLFETVDGRYDDINNPLADCRIGSSLEEIASMDEEMRHREMLIRMRGYVDSWKELEVHGYGIYRSVVNDGSIVGLITLKPQEGKRSIDAEMGCMLMSEHCGKGIATQAVRLMLEEGFRLCPKLHRVTAWVYAPNKAASRVLEKNGFQVEGILRESVMCEGRPTDRIAYGFVRKMTGGSE